MIIQMDELLSTDGFAAGIGPVLCLKVPGSILIAEDYIDIL